MVRKIPREPEAIIGALASLFRSIAPLSAPPFLDFFDSPPGCAAIDLPPSVVERLPAFDPLGELYQSLQPRLNRKRQGLYFTPERRARELVERASLDHPQAILDPACGSGRLLALAHEAHPSAQIFGVDLDPIAVAICRANLWLSGMGNLDALKACIHVGDALDALPSSFPLEFDGILANPPYIAHYARGSLGSGKRTVSHSGRYHSGADFLERFAHRLNASGRLAFLLPDTLLTARSFAPLRMRLNEIGAPIEADRCTEANTFHGATVGEALLIWERGAHVRPNLESSWLALPSPSLQGDWIALRDLAWVRDGVNPGAASTRQKILALRPGGPEWEPALVGGDIAAFRLSAPAQWLWMSPNALDADDKRRGASLRQPWVFVPDRIVTRQTANRPIAAIERKGRPTLNSAHNIGLLEPNDTILKALCAFLNSDLAADLLRAASGEIRASFPQVHVATLRDLRVPAVLADPLHADTLALAEWHDRLAADPSQRADFEACVNQRFRGSADQALEKAHVFEGDHVGVGGEPAFALPRA